MTWSYRKIILNKIKNCLPSNEWEKYNFIWCLVLLVFFFPDSSQGTGIQIEAFFLRTCFPTQVDQVWHVSVFLNYCRGVRNSVHMSCHWCITFDCRFVWGTASRIVKSIPRHFQRELSKEKTSTMNGESSIPELQGPNKNKRGTGGSIGNADILFVSVSRLP